MRNRTKKLLWMAIALIIVGAIGWLTLGGKSTGAAERYKAELRAKGEKISFGELGFPKPPEDSRGVVQLTNSVNRIRRSNFDAGLFTTVPATVPGRLPVIWRGAGVSRHQSTNWMAWEEFGEFIGNISDELAEVRLAAESPVRHYRGNPIALYTNAPGGSMFPFVEMRMAAQLLYCDGIEALHRDDLTRARQDHRAMIQLTEFCRDDPMLVPAMIRVAIAGLTLQFTWQALQHPGWKPEELAAMQQDWERIDLLAAVESGFAGERAATEMAFALARDEGLTWIKQSFKSGSSSSPWEHLTGMAAHMLWNADEDELYALQYHQAMLDCIRAVRSGNAWSEVGGILQSRQAAHTRTLAGANGMNRFRYLLSAIVIPNTTKAVQTTVRHETQRRLIVTAIALKRFQFRHQRLPAKLEELVPEFLAALPVDPMDARPLRYRRESETEFVLYTVGDDGKDDGGDPTPAGKVSQHDWWTGRDTVWPKQAD